MQVRIKILAITAVVGGLLLIIVHDNSNSTWQNLEATLVVMANVWGLVAGLVLLGFGLIEVCTFFFFRLIFSHNLSCNAFKKKSNIYVQA